MSKSLQLNKLIKDYLRYLLRVRGYSEATIRTYELPLRQMLAHHRLVKEGDGWILDIMPLRRIIASNKARTVAKKLSAIRSFVRYLCEQLDIPITLKGDESLKLPQTLPKPIEGSYIFEAFENADIRERLILALLYGLGLRVSELASLKRDQISREWVRIDGKGGKSRQLPIPPIIREILERYLLLYPQGIYLLEKGGRALNTSQIRYLVQKLFGSRGLKVSPHQLRHSFATHLLLEGARISDVSEMLGHSSMATTQIYTKLGSSHALKEYLKAHPLGAN